MRSRNMMRLMALMAVMAMLVIAIPVTAQTRFIELTPEQGTIGTKVTVVGEGFNASTETTDKYAIIYFSNEEASISDKIDTDVTIYEIVEDAILLDEEGAFEVEFTVPDKMSDGDETEDVVSGTYYVYVCHYATPPTISTNIRAKAEFTVIGGEITIDPEEGLVGTEVEINGEQFGARENIEITYDDKEVDIKSGDSKTDSNGEFVCTILIPESIAGAHTITVTVAASEVEAEFTVAPEAVLTPTSGSVGANVSVSGTGFGRRSDVMVYFNAGEVATTTTGSDGSFSTTFTVPEIDDGTYDVEAEDDDGNMGTAEFKVTAAQPTQPTSPTAPPSPTLIKIEPSSGKAGSNLGISGAGFEGGGAVTIKFGEQVLDTVTADASGRFIALVKVPSLKAGEYTITISDGTNTNDEMKFAVEATPPPIPAPLLPEMGVKAKTPVIFDWENVTVAVAPVSYTLQVATDDKFTQSSIVLERTDLASSEYVTTEAESLELAARETAYYWRVRAIDAAENEGEWTGAGEFYVSRPFSVPKWAMYTMLGLGGLVLFILGYWMGRRTAYYYTF